MSKTETAIRWMEQLAADNSHGYSQANRWGPDYDCSSAVIQAWEIAGVPVKTKGATYTGNMYAVFLSCGFRDITSQINLNTGSGLQRGDVLLNHVNHTAMVTEPGRVVHARSSEGNTTPGDQSGNEIRIQNYWNYPWNAVLRYSETGTEETEENGNEEIPVINDAEAPPITEVKNMAALVPLLTLAVKDEKREDVKAFQALFNIRFSGELKINGYYDEKTEAACRYVQKSYGLDIDGECGRDTWAALIRGN